MTCVVTSLGLCDNACMNACLVECINPGGPAEQWPTFYSDPQTCIDCGACVPECPFSAIFPVEEVPMAIQAAGVEFIHQPGLSGHFAGVSYYWEPFVLENTRVLTADETVDLTECVYENANI